MPRKKQPVKRAAKPKQNKNVDIKQVSNGWIVSQWDERGKQITKIAKTKAEAKQFAVAMLGL